MSSVMAAPCQILTMAPSVALVVVGQPMFNPCMMHRLLIKVAAAQTCLMLLIKKGLTKSQLTSISVFKHSDVKLVVFAERQDVIIQGFSVLLTILSMPVTLRSVMLVVSRYIGELCWMPF